MAIDATEVRTAPFAQIYVAAVGTALPVDATVALNASFTSLGYVDDDGIEVSPDINLQDIMMMQSAVPVLTTNETAQLELKFQMGQVNTTTWGLFFFGAAWVNNFGQAKITLASNPGTQERALIIEWSDNLDDNVRLVVPRAVLTKRDALKLNRKSAQLSGVTFRALDNSGVLAYVYSDNPDLVPAS